MKRKRRIDELSKKEADLNCRMRQLKREGLGDIQPMIPKAQAIGSIARRKAQLQLGIGEGKRKREAFVELGDREKALETLQTQIRLNGRQFPMN